MRIPSLMIAIACAGCGGPALLRGDTEGPNMALHIGATVENMAAKIEIEVENRAEDAVGIDVDAIRLRDHQGQRYAALGVPQRFVRRGGQSVTRRVPHGAVNIPPGQKKKIALEFEKLPEKEESFSLVLPALYKLSIEGQVGLKAIRVPLRPGQPEPIAVAEKGDGGQPGGFYDPFAESGEP